MSYPTGSYPPYGAPVPPTPTPPTSGKALGSVICGVLSLFVCGFFTGIPAIILGVSARREIRESGGSLSGDGLALGGIITGIIGSILGLLVLGLVISAIAIGTSVDTVVDRCDELAQDNNLSNDCT